MKFSGITDSNKHIFKMDRKVIVFKSESSQGKDPYEKALLEARFEPYVLPVIQFKFSNLDVLVTKLQEPSKYCGIIFTSERCVEAVELALGSDRKTVMSDWGKLRVLCAGPATQTRVLKGLGIEAHLGEKHRAEGIVDVLKQAGNFDRPFLYPCGELASAKDTLRSSLLEINIHCDAVVTYSTLTNPALESTLDTLFQNADWPKFLVFFSPSGFKSVLEIVKKLPDMDVQFKTLNFVAIGPTTATAIKELGYDVWAEAAFPNPHCLVQTILEATKTSTAI